MSGAHIPAARPVLDPRVAEAAGVISERLALSTPPDVGVVLGSGLGSFVDSLGDHASVPFSDVPHVPTPTVAGHAGSFCLGTIDSVRVLCQSGRAHAYEGHDVRDVVFCARLLATLGCRVVLLTNAAGGIREGLSPGSLLLIADHLNLTGRNPLVGSDHPFVDLTVAYDADVRAAAHRAAAAANVALSEGTYAGLLGPSYETPAEIRMLRTLGADAVGMSTVLEVIALRQMGTRVGAVSCITNLAAGLTGSVLSHEDVQATARRAKSAFEALLTRWIPLVAGLDDSEA